MFPPRQGNDCLEVGSRFAISVYGTENVFTADGEKLRVQAYQGKPTQVWICVEDGNHEFGFLNEKTGKHLGRDDCTKLTCFATGHSGWEFLRFTYRSSGGYTLSVRHKEKYRPAVAASDADGMYMRVAGESSTAIGLHQLEEAVFRRFRWVIPGRLARASAPHYHSHDEDQCMDHIAVDFLVQHAVKSIISLNSQPLSKEEMTLLVDHRITYTHLPLEEFGTATLAQLEAVNSHYINNETTIVYCGYGHARTGTAISALQLYSGRRLAHSDYRENNVQAADQHKVLDKLKQSLRYCDLPQRTLALSLQEPGRA